MYDINNLFNIHQTITFLHEAIWEIRGKIIS